MISFESLEVCLETYLKCLNFDFIAILLNETLEEPSQTNLPASWASIVEDEHTVGDLFNCVLTFLLKLPFTNNKQNNSIYKIMKNVINLALKCLCEYANIRLTLFTNQVTKNKYIENFTKHLIHFIQSSSVKGPDEIFIE